MVRHNIRHGQGKLGCIIWLTILALFLFACAKFIPVKINTAELYDFMEEQAKWAGRTKDKDLHKRIMTRAKELELPLKAKNLTITRTGGRIRMKAVYSVPIEFPGYTYVMKVQHVIDRAVFVV
jgi:hypothetical protein